MNDSIPKGEGQTRTFDFSNIGTDTEINIRELVDIVWSGKWVVAFIAFIAAIVGIVLALLSKPVYEADGLIQIEQESNKNIGNAISQISSLIGAPPSDAPAEIALIKSRMVLNAVSEKLKLYIHAEPVYFPIIGEFYSRRHPFLYSGHAPFDLDSYAWGNESIEISAFDVPETVLDRLYILHVEPSGYRLTETNGKEVLQGTVGVRATATTDAGTFSIFVQQINANPGARFKVSRLSTPVILDRLVDSLKVTEQPRDSGVITIKIQAETRQDAADRVNAVQESYLKQNVERRSAQAAQSLDFLKEQLPKLKEDVDSAQARLNAYQLSRGTVDVQQETQLVLSRVVDLETQRQNLMQERSASLQRFTGQHPVIATISERIKGVEQEQNNLKKQIETLPQTQQEILKLMRDLQVSTQLYTTLLNSAQQLQITKAGTVGNVRIVDEALLPPAPIKPNRPQIVLMAFAIGIFLGIITVFAMRTLMRGVDRPEQVESALGLPTYASVPYSNTQRRIIRMTRTRNAAGENHILAALESNDLAIEALRGLRTSLHFAMLDAPNNIVMLTGPMASLGKSFISINLGALLAMSGKKVLVVDADLRRGHLYRYVGVPQNPGLSDFIASSERDPKTIIHTTSIKGLDFIAGGTRPPNPAEIVMTEKFNDTLKQLSALYDYVLIDTPPVLPVTDASIIGRLAGTTLLVLKSAEHPMRAIEETVKRLRQAGVFVKGTIFNQVGARLGSYGYGSYGYAYGYSSYRYKKDD